MARTFLRAEWRKLLMFNYAVNEDVLKPYLPPHTELDLFEGKCYVSLIGFMFLNTKLLGFSVPFHRNFEEVNLRFYVRHFDGTTWKRGVVFIKEIVPKIALTLVANNIYKESYETLPMKHSWTGDQDHLKVAYSWKKSVWHHIEATAGAVSVAVPTGSAVEFITEHYWGYTRSGKGSSEYGVEHPRWSVYDVQQYEINVDFGLVYGADFKFLTGALPASVFLAEGSEIVVNSKRHLGRR